MTVSGWTTNGISKDNILVSNEPEEGLRLYVIDWELARCTRSEVDVGKFVMMSWSVADRYSSQDCFRLAQEFCKSYQKHYAVDILQVALRSGTELMSWGTIVKWARDGDEQTLKAITRTGVDLLEAARERDIDSIRKSVVLRQMYAV